jgi:hypothetical protein
MTRTLFHPTSSGAPPDAPTQPRAHHITSKMDGHLHPHAMKSWRSRDTSPSASQAGRPMALSPLRSSFPSERVDKPKYSPKDLIATTTPESQENQENKVTQETPIRHSRPAPLTLRPRGESRSSSVPAIRLQDSDANLRDTARQTRSRPGSPLPGYTDGRTSKSVKHLTCFWWKSTPGGCKKSEDECRKWFSYR